MGLVYFINMRRFTKYLIIPIIIGTLSIGYFAITRYTNSEPKKTKIEMIQEWQDYVPILNEGLENLLKDNALFVVHSGSVKIHGAYEGYRKKGYDTYLKNIKNKIAESIRDERTVILYIEEFYKEETLDVLGIKDVTQVILVPTYDSTFDRNITFSKRYGIDMPPYMNLSHEEFYKKISSKVKTGEIGGEMEQLCFATVERYLKEAGINVRRLEDCIFPFID